MTNNNLLSKENILVIILVISITGLIFPYGFPLFSLLVLALFYINLIKYKMNVRVSIYTILIFISIILYFISIFITNTEISSLVWDDIINILCFVLILLMLGNISILEYKLFLKKLFYVLSVQGIIIALFSLYKYYLLLKGIKLEFLLKNNVQNYPWGTSLVTDYNMFALGLMFSLLSYIFLFKKSNSVIRQVYCLSGFILVTSSIVLSGSRRGWLVIMLPILYLLFIFVKKLFTVFMSNKFNINIYFSFSIVAGLCLSLFFYLPKNNLNFSEFENLLYRFSTMSNLNSSFSSRTERWLFGWDLIKDFNIIQILFGDGFNYLNKYGQFFLGGGQDYPHNILISTLLYSGLLGLVPIILILLLPLYRLFVYRKIYSNEMLLLYILTILFLFPSSNTLFSVRLLLLLIIIIISVKINNINRQVYNEKCS